ncbi:Transmembrane channel-like protein 7, partial [Stegodyphus mimosarum]
MCGPFKDFDKTGDLIRNIFFKKGEEYHASEIIKYISSPGVMFAVFCALCVVVYYMRAQAKAHISVVKKIREQLIMEGKDKAFLLRLFDEAFSQSEEILRKNVNLGQKESHNPCSPQNGISQEVIVNQLYSDYERPAGSPPPKNFSPGYIPANVPVNQSSLVESDHRYQKENSISPNGQSFSRTFAFPEEDIPHHKRRGPPYPSHEPGFRYLRQGERIPEREPKERISEPR